MPQVVQPGISHDYGRVAHLDSEPPQIIRTSRSGPLSPGNTHSPDAVSARQCSSFRPASASRACLGPVFASISADRSGLTSHQRMRRIFPSLPPGHHRGVHGTPDPAALFRGMRKYPSAVGGHHRPPHHRQRLPLRTDSFPSPLRRP